MEYAIVDLMGHVRIAGKWSIEDGLVRVKDILGSTPNKEQWFGMGAIYSITPCTRQQAEVVLPWHEQSCLYCEAALNGHEGLCEDGVDRHDEIPF